MASIVDIPKVAKRLLDVTCETFNCWMQRAGYGTKVR